MIVKRIPVVLMRGGPSRALCFQAVDLPSPPRLRDALLLRALGGPDPSMRLADGIGAGGDGTTHVVLVSRSQAPDCDVDFLCGAVGPDAAFVDWGARCDALAAAVAPYAIAEGVYPADDGTARVRLRHLPDGVRIDAYVQVEAGRVVERGTFAEDGVPFASAEVRLEVLSPIDVAFPTGLPRETLAVPGLGDIDVTLVGGREPVVFARAASIGLTGREAPDDVNRSRRVLERLDAVRACAAARLEAVAPRDGARSRTGAPMLCWVAKPAAYRALGGRDVPADTIDLLARFATAGRLDAGCDGHGTLALAVAAAVPGTVVAEVARTLPGVATRIGHVRGTLAVGAEVSARPRRDGGPAWGVDRCLLSRGARRLFAGVVHVPAAG